MRSMLVVCCHPDTWPDGFVDEVPSTGLHVQKLMLAQRRKNRFLAQQIPHDFLGGASCEWSQHGFVDEVPGMGLSAQKLM